MNIQTKQAFGEGLNEQNKELQMEHHWKFVQKGQKVGEELKDTTPKYFSNIQRPRFFGQLWARFLFFGNHTELFLSLRGRSLCLADSPHAAWRKQTAPVLLFWALLWKLLLFLTRFMCCLQIHTGGFLLKFPLLHFPGGRNPHGFVTFSGVMWLTWAEIQPLGKFSTF